MINKDVLKLSVLRMLISAVKNKEIEKKTKEDGLSEEEIMEVVLSEAKKRKDAAEQYEKSGRTESAEQEKSELEILSAYLPDQLTEEELSGLIEAAIAESGAASQQDFGKVMKILASKIKGRSDTKAVIEIIKNKLE